MLDWHGSGMSVMEMSHRGKEYMNSPGAEAEADLRELLGIPANYKVLFLQGGASTQFAMVPMNLLRGKASADYSNTGEWSKKGDQGSEEIRQGQRRRFVASSRTRISPMLQRSRPGSDPDAAYVHYTPNETIGVEIFNAGNRLGAAGGRHVLEHPPRVRST